MKKLLLICLPVFSPAVAPSISWSERMQTCNTLEYQRDEKPLTVKLNNPRQQVSFVYDNQLLHLKQGISASGARYTDGSLMSSGRKARKRLSINATASS